MNGLRKIVLLLGLVVCMPLEHITTINYPTLSRIEARCLYDNVYHEARGEPFQGQVAVARVTLNRAKDKSICKAVYAPKQFSWVGKGYKTKRDSEEYYRAHLASWEAFNADYGVTHYHANYVNPRWKLKYEFTIGNHHFYK